MRLGQRSIESGLWGRAEKSPTPLIESVDLGFGERVEMPGEKDE